MGYGWTMTRADLHRLVDELPEASLEPAAVLLERAQDPAIARLEAAPWDDEPFTDEETLWFFDLVQVSLEIRKIDLAAFRDLLSHLLDDTRAA